MIIMVGDSDSLSAQTHVDADPLELYQWIEEAKDAGNVKKFQQRQMITRDHIKRLDNGRFVGMIDHEHKLVSRMDIDRREKYADQVSDRRLDWLALYGIAEDLNGFDHLRDGR